MIGKIQPPDDHLAATWNMENTRQWREQERWAAKLIDRCVAREHVFATFARAVVGGRKVAELRIQEERERAARARDVRVARWGPPDHWNEFGPCTSLTSPGTTPSGMPMSVRRDCLGHLRVGGENLVHERPVPLNQTYLPTGIAAHCRAPPSASAACISLKYSFTRRLWFLPPPSPVSALAPIHPS